MGEIIFSSLVGHVTLIFFLKKEKIEVNLSKNEVKEG